MENLSKEFIALNRLGIKDIGSLINLSNLVGWDYDESELKTVLSCGHIFGHKNINGEVVSSAAIIPYENKLASLGMVIVNQDYRGLGLGKEIVEACIDKVPINNSIILISTEEGKPLYERMGFTTVDYIHKFIGQNIKYSYIPNKYDLRVESITEKDINEIIELDKEAFGDKRTSLIKNRINQSHDNLIVKDKTNNLKGFGLSIKGPENLILGPIVAPDIEMALFIISKLTKNYSGKIRIDVPSEQKVFIDALRKIKFKEVSIPPVMMLKSDTMPKRNGHLYGITAQIFG
ncbi:GNAT family N-acetyltransferase (plasmid) [Bacillus sp. ZJS3]|uniref:GNAT family N-acetyltransferase n=1 Tax=Bacillus sp. ZJS3 TaxID=2928154 RepID=UPI001FB36529|nr:GNAT family N-acetyltransferase [Bacillus sp. ZJS3]UOB81853.1 GNAT family N-acetyltransferase [Bacillus sp. ZJS3]